MQKKRRFASAAASIVLAAVLLAPAAFGASAKTIDASKPSFPASFLSQAKKARESFQAGKSLAIPFSPASAITKQKLSTLTIRELNELEASFFPANTKWFDDDHNPLYGKVSAAKLSPEKKKVVETIRAERKAAESTMPKIKNGVSLDLNADGKKESIALTQSGEYEMKVSIGSASFSYECDGVRDAYTIDLDGKQKALLVGFLQPSDWIDTYIFFYDGKSLNALPCDFGAYDDLRYAGNGVFYCERVNMPVSSVTQYKVTKGKISELAARGQAPLMAVTVGDASIKCKSLDGGTVTFKSGETLSVLTSIPVAHTTETETSTPAYIAIMNKSSKVGLLKSDDYGYMIAGDVAEFIAAFEGFYFQS